MMITLPSGQPLSTWWRSLLAVTSELPRMRPGAPQPMAATLSLNCCEVAALFVTSIQRRPIGVEIVEQFLHARQRPAAHIDHAIHIENAARTPASVAIESVMRIGHLPAWTKSCDR